MATSRIPSDQPAAERLAHIEGSLDPTLLTVESLRREIEWVRQESAWIKDTLHNEFVGMQRAVDLLQSNADKSPTIGELHSKHEQMFRNIEVQFAERDTRTEQTAKDSKVAVDAALQAAKEAVGEQNKSSAAAIQKSEASTTKQIDGIISLIQANGQGVTDKIDDIKSRLTIIEGKALGGSDNMAGIISIVSGIAALMAIVVAIIAIFK